MGGSGGKNRCEYRMFLLLKRQWPRYVFDFAILVLEVITACSSFFVPFTENMLSDRMSITLTVLLTIVATTTTRPAVIDKLPYSTLHDLFEQYMLGSVVLMVLENVMVFTVCWGSFKIWGSQDKGYDQGGREGGMTPLSGETSVFNQFLFDKATIFWNSELHMIMEEPKERDLCRQSDLCGSSFLDCVGLYFTFVFIVVTVASIFLQVQKYRIFQLLKLKFEVDSKDRNPSKWSKLIMCDDNSLRFCSRTDEIDAARSVALLPCVRLFMMLWYRCHQVREILHAMLARCSDDGDDFSQVFHPMRSKRLLKDSYEKMRKDSTAKPKISQLKLRLKPGESLRILDVGSAEIGFYTFWRDQETSLVHMAGAKDPKHKYERPKNFVQQYLDNEEGAVLLATVIASRFGMDAAALDTGHLRPDHSAGNKSQHRAWTKMFGRKSGGFPITPSAKSGRTMMMKSHSTVSKNSNQGKATRFQQLVNVISSRRDSKGKSFEDLTNIARVPGKAWDGEISSSLTPVTPATAGSEYTPHSDSNGSVATDSAHTQDERRKSFTQSSGGGRGIASIAKMMYAKHNQKSFGLIGASSPPSEPEESSAGPDSSEKAEADVVPKSRIVLGLTGSNRADIVHDPTAADRLSNFCVELERILEAYNVECVPFVPTGEDEATYELWACQYLVQNGDLEVGHEVKLDNAFRLLHGDQTTLDEVLKEYKDLEAEEHLRAAFEQALQEQQSTQQDNDDENGEFEGDPSNDDNGAVTSQSSSGEDSASSDTESDRSSSAASSSSERHGSPRGSVRQLQRGVHCISAKAFYDKFESSSALMRALTREKLFAGSMSVGGGGCQITMRCRDDLKTSQVHSMPLGNQTPNRIAGVPKSDDAIQTHDLADGRYAHTRRYFLKLVDEFHLRNGDSTTWTRKRLVLWEELITNGLLERSMPMIQRGVFLGIGAVYHAAKEAKCADRLLHKDALVTMLRAKSEELLMAVHDMEDSSTMLSLANVTLVRVIIEHTLHRSALIVCKRNWTVGESSFVASWALGLFLGTESSAKDAPPKFARDIKVVRGDDGNVLRKRAAHRTKSFKGMVADAETPD
eukprot:gnl/TRDRNA2_/TRDRNA2_145733_c1_seq1.p1 gnl/TRDRNA2_/TRDRNA2_145733_c1~~gnl/TRDRNA2_/TRDRNA2_145733_c1_seq1.p1  ORF type:complete len:1161 (+),score=168.05 gnl/TRDRNA2_/TRDRNA2_145733_c1_seq1:236-3484(+)